MTNSYAPKVMAALASGVIASAALTTGSIADPLADFYKGKDIRVVIGFSAGGGYDVYARAVTKHMQKHIPGNPNIVPQNMTGAGSRRAANYIYNVAPKDGTVVGTVAQSVALDQLVGESGVMYDAPKFTWIGNSIADNNITAVWASTGITTIEEARVKGGVVCGATGGTSPAVTAPQIINNLIGTNFKIIRGYPGGAVINLALERGEVNCRGSNSWSSTKSTQTDQLENKQLNILLQWGPRKDPEISKYAGRDVPLVSEFAKTEEDRLALEIIDAAVSIGRPLLAPPGLPSERVEALRRAFDLTMKDAEFLDFAKKGMLDLNPVPGAELQKIVAKVIATPPRAVNRMRELLSQRDVSELELAKASGKIQKIEKRNLSVTADGGASVTLNVHPKRSKVTVAGKPADASALQVNMSCSFSYLGVNGEVAEASCK